ncbi:HpcH/HpaI aldolase family protein [Niabella drilacis]|uniref:4-hydroxy-2-oxoheptanedioate aldolase n=1 Tax=Niabella drilacis (strain DSM 25811 / CCM 8410 / CCUG 62505 / LMG 26954 / E90) TaxID=1285928 RepID=A0A1G6LW88_NIADE|nr:aldolase/citrate lyase family protein [Niabella drilacis]SDC47481.1 4-hydroxy-2-oxoheptanedioate aldolase [Niabella drilacis]
MRSSKVLQKLRSGGFASCIKINISNAQVVELAARSGFDCIWVDQEHCAPDWQVLNSQVWAAKAYDADLLVRVPRGSYSDLVRPLEMDATGIMVPHIMSLQDAAGVVHMTRFHPLGRRPIDGGNADGGYTNMDFQEYLATANRERFVILQIEDPEPLKDLDAIAQLEGYDMLFFGPGDFSQGIGAPGNFSHPELLEARKKVAAAARRYGKFAGTTGSIDHLDAFKEMGYQFVSVGADVVGLSGYFQGLSTRIHASGTSTAKGNEAYK